MYIMVSFAAVMSISINPVCSFDKSNVTKVPFAAVLISSVVVLKEIGFWFLSYKNKSLTFRVQKEVFKVVVKEFFNLIGLEQSLLSGLYKYIPSAMIFEDILFPDEMLLKGRGIKLLLFVVTTELK